MFQQLVSHNQDLRQLVEKGYAVSFDSNYLVIRDIPYLDNKGQLRIGAFVSKIIIVNETQVRLDDHQVFFCGSHPHHDDGSPIQNLNPRPATLTLISDDLKVQLALSAKPKGGYKDLFHKIDSYCEIIAGPAIANNDVTPYTFNGGELLTDSPFKVWDTLTSRAEIGDLNTNIKNDVVAIIGLGGTGSYILDFIVKAPVKEIRAFDSDTFHVHNALRSPGKLDNEELGRAKADVYKSRYEGLRHGLNILPMNISSDSRDELMGVTFAFVCIDNGPSRKEIFDLLVSMKIPFIDTGMGLNREQSLIGGMLRVTFYPSENGGEMVAKGYASMIDDRDDIYKENIQLSELNALNASLAVLRYKQIRGFYLEEFPKVNTLLGIHDLHMVSD